MRISALLLGLAVGLASFAPAALAQHQHEADGSISDASCTTAQPCDLQIYRAQCTSATACPSFTSSPTSFLALPTDTAHQTATVSTAGTSWAVIDNDPAILDSTSYVYVSVAAYQAAPGVWSAPSVPTVLTFPGPPKSPSGAWTVKK